MASCTIIEGEVNIQFLQLSFILIISVDKWTTSEYYKNMIGKYLINVSKEMTRFCVEIQILIMCMQCIAMFMSFSEYSIKIVNITIKIQLVNIPEFS